MSMLWNVVKVAIFQVTLPTWDNVLLKRSSREPIPRTPFHTNDHPTTLTWPMQSLHVYTARR
jgi:hypothetical protein